MGKAQLFSRKELAMLKQASNDPHAAKQNIEILQGLLINDTSLQELLPDPLTMRGIIERIGDQLNASNLRMDESKNFNEKLFPELVKEIANLYNKSVLATTFFDFSKRTKIKKYKRLFLWCVSEVLSHRDDSLSNSYVIGTITRSAMEITMRFNATLEAFLNGEDSIGFDAEKVARDEINRHAIDGMMNDIYPIIGPFVHSLNSIALHYYRTIEKPVGLRFFHILHYPELNQLEPSVPQESEEHSYPSVNVMKVMGKDLQSGMLRNAYKKFILEFKAAAQESVPEKVLPRVLNAVAFLIRIPMDFYPFVLEVYRSSGKQADEINPPDELECIREIMAEHEAPAAYRKYGDLLYEKGELFGAYCAYNRMAMLLPKDELGDEFLQYMKDIENRLIEGKWIDLYEANYLSNEEKFSRYMETLAQNSSDESDEEEKSGTN